MAQTTLGEYLAAKIRAAIAGALEDEKGTLEAIAKQAGGNVNVNLGGGTGSIVGLLSALGFASGQLEVVAVLDALNAAESGVGGAGLGYGLGYLFASLIAPSAEPYTRQISHAVEQAAQSQIYDPGTVAALRAAGIWTLSKTTPGNEAGGGGLDSEHLAGLIESEYSYPPWEVGLELLRRGLILPTDLTIMMDRGKVPLAYQPQLAELQRVLLSPADLALNVLRGFMAPADASAYAQLLGVVPEDFQRVLDNTGEPPGTMQLLEAYRRNIIPRDRLERGIRQSRVRPEWIDAIEALRFQPMSVSDAVNAAVQNHLPKDQASQLAAEAGLNPDHFETLYQNHGRPLSRTEMISLYHRGLASPDEFDQAMRESDIKDKYIQHAFELGRTLIPARQIVTAIAHGAMDMELGIRQLMMQGYTDSDARVLVRTGTAEHHATLKDLSKTDITALYTDHLMPRSEAHAHLVKLGYTDQVADWILGLADARKAASLARALSSQVKALLQKGDVDRQAAVTKLVEGGVKREDALALVDEWTLLHTTPSKQLSESQVVKAAKDGIIAPDYAFTRLQGLGYDKTDGVILLMIAGFSPDQIDPGFTPGVVVPPSGGVTGPTPQLPPR